MMALLPLFVFWGLWFLNFSTRAIFSPILPLILVTFILQATLSVGLFPAGLAAVSNLTPLSERSMAIGMAISIGVIFGMGGAPFVF